MDLSQFLRSTVLVITISLLSIQANSAFIGTRPKRQYGANMYLPDTYIIPGGDGNDQDWGEWQSPSECSRSCGGGVSYQTRDCLRIDPNTGASLCTGGSTRYFSCNTQDCPEDEPDFRSQQCARYNHLPFDGIYYDWVPYTNAPNPCELNCMPRGERFYYRQKAKVIDGTRCNDRELDVCVDGKCQPVGCDMMLGSNAKEDNCRKCGGDGGSCETVADTYKSSNLAAGYNDILLIPTGATNIRIQETEPSNNYLACRNLTSYYYLNGNWRIDFPRPMFYAGCWWNYQRKPNGFAAPDQLTCSGPTTESIYIVMLVQDKTVSVDYEYSIPTTIHRSTPQVYTWTHMEFSACSVNCGGGNQTRTVTCNNRLTLEEVDQSLCDVNTKPDESQACGTEPCAPHWQEEAWGKCSKGCGSDGVQNRTVSCVRTSPNGERKVEEDSVCLQLVGNKPATQQECNRDVKNCPKYHLGPWTPCDKLCGDGKQTRKVTCYMEENGHKKVLDDAECTEEKPITVKSCLLFPCEGVDWIISEWSGCNACGQTVETRTAMCGSKSGKIYADEFCAPEVPMLSRPCKSKKCISQWFTSEWSDCSAPCGKGIQSRIVICGEFDGETVTPAQDDSKCSAAKKPKAEQSCEGLTKECPGQWFTGPWGPCDKPCGGGQRVREVLCLANGTKSLNCDENKVESLSEKCNSQSCDEDELLPLDSTAAPFTASISYEEEFEECDDYNDEEELDDEDQEYENTSNPDDDVEILEKSQKLQLRTGIELGDTTIDNHSSYSEDDELMLSDSPVTDEPLTTIMEGSGTDMTEEYLTTFEGSGEDLETSESTTYASTVSEAESTSTTESIEATTKISQETDSTSELVSSFTTNIFTTTDTTESSDSTTLVESSSVETSSVSESTSESTTESASVFTKTTDTTESTTDSSTESTSTEFSSSTSTEFSSSTSTEFSSSTSTESLASTEISTLVSNEPSSTSPDTSTEESIIASSTTDITTETTETLTDSTTEELITETTDSTTDSSPSTYFTDISNTESSVSTELTSEASTESTASTVTAFTESSLATESTEFTVTESTETTESVDDISTDSSTDTTLIEESSTIDIWSTSEMDDETESSTKYTFTTLVHKKRKCKPKKRKDCKYSQYGCCPDNKTTAIGPFDEGCPIPKTCADTKYGCCPDGLSPAKGKNKKGCPKSQCSETLFGCCSDKHTPAEGENDEGCPEPTTLPPTTTIASITTTEFSTESTTITELQKSCSFSEFGCCPDGEAKAQGENFKGCKIEPQDCKESTHGCCRDGRTAAQGPDEAGCPTCTQEPFGCCPDSNTPAHGPLGEGCCLNSPYGCCPDNINYANGPNHKDCSCEYTPYGCCPDKKTAAQGPANEGCGCENTEHGCCPDKLTAAKGDNFEGCACHTMQYGCCPDGLTFAKGPHHYGCHCSQTEYKCCGDDKTPAQGPNQEGCTCAESKYGCCPDGITPAQDDKFAGCENVKEPRQKSCALQKETGPCSNYSIKYFYDTSYGSCAKFWYGGCEGNENRFESEAECKGICQEYEGKERCLLPKNSGPCTGFYKKFYFNANRGRCEEFTYGGCYGTTNRFDTLEECQHVCDIADTTPPCEQPADSGPCEGSYERWYYDNETDVCRPFNYGGCKGNKNNHPTEHACNYNCRQPGVFKDQCLLPKQTGDCSEQHPRWYYDELSQKCNPFYYTGCGGNKNNFPTLESCESHCPKKVAKDICEIPAEVGECTNYTSMWYFDTQEQRCLQFYYGGCGGNDHKFATEEACLARCEKRPENSTPATPPQQPQPPAPEAASSDVCSQPAVQGDCENYEIFWYYNNTYGACLQFYYGGCGGNSNRFLLKTECESSCKQTTKTTTTNRTPPAILPPVSQKDPCQQQTDAGDCDEYTIKWSYNITAATCEPFYYGGCGGNENRFENEDDCLSSCTAVPAESAVAETDACFSPVDAGQCAGLETRWYYNAAEGLCDQFNYTGCGGNANKYVTEEECENRCSQVQNICSLPAVQGRCNDTSVRWYYDERVQLCYEFEFTGCRGNKNNFMSERECMDYCRPSSNYVTNQPTPYAHCDLLPEEGNCTNFTTAWFYDSETLQCTAFTYTGCGGNANRFETKEQCDRQCGDFRGIDVCSEPVSAGPCQQWQTRFFFNNTKKTCEPFTYGGCEGTANRFTDRAECESVCIVGSEPHTIQNKEICKLPVVIGKCVTDNLQERRYYYDDERGECVAFIYSGCSGNQNNFRSYQTCYEFCRTEYNETSNEVLTSKCEGYEEECRHLRCPYGTRRVALNDPNNCYRCECDDPCVKNECPEGQQCKVDVDSSQRFVPVCREINKLGECPVMSADNRICGSQCNTDADCGGDSKCCSNGCGFLCVRPYTPPATPRPTTAAPKVFYPGERKAELEPKKQHELDVSTSLGNIAVLRCYATGSPPPNVTWSRRNVVIDTTQGRYVLTSSGDLNIVQVKQTDSGSYVCVASNGLGEPVRREVQLEVTAPVNIPAYIHGDRNVTQIAILNMPASIRCLAGGQPAPLVSWWRNGIRLGQRTARTSQLADHSLYFKSLQLSDLGLYTCEAYNGVDRAMAKRIILQAYGPARAINPEDKPFLQYIVDPVNAPITERPSYPYRPTRPAYVPPPPPSYYVTPQQTTLVKSKAELVFDPKNTYTVGSTVTVRCIVEGHPAPEVTWTKDGATIIPDGRIQLIFDPYSLVINDARPEDTGVYDCTARNSFSHSTAMQKLNIQSSVYVPPECQDNPYYANCKRIVQGNYCNKNSYFAKFCCRSCALAGQISGQLLQNAI